MKRRSPVKNEETTEVNSIPGESVQYKGMMSIGFRPTVDGNELAMLALAQLVNDLGKGFLSATAFTSDQYRHVGGCYLCRYLYGVVEQRRIADDAKPVFYALYFLFSQNEKALGCYCT